jgi:cell division protein FtsI (penicillin-binding protein 3)
MTKRYTSIIVIVVLLAVLIIVRALGFMTFQRRGWQTVASRFEADSVIVQPQRGSILSDEGRVLISSTPEYQFVFKYREFTRDRDEQRQRDDSVRKYIGVYAAGLHRLIPEQSADEFRKLIESALSKGSQSIENNRRTGLYTNLYTHGTKRLTYNRYKEVKEFLDSCNKAFMHTEAPRGFTFDEMMIRKNAYGLATRTLGQWNEQGGFARNGIELAFDSLLSGTPGFSHRRKVMNTYAEYVDVAPQNGCDIVTTLNVRIQDIANKALRDQMEEQNADFGTAIVMETKTGDVKAIVNLTRQDGQFVIGSNIALNQGIETGSIFKTASMLAALDDHEVVLQDSVNTYPYARNFYGFNMSDDSKREPWKTIPKILKYSSNVGTMTVIDEHYVKKGKPEAFLKKLLSMGIAEDHRIMPGTAQSKLITPAQIKEWKGAALWMSVGYGISVTPMNMVSFYNAIANGGKMMRPRLIKEIQRDGHTVERFDNEVAIEHIASPEAIADITQCLIGVVNSDGGTGTRARSDRFLIAGKTGTAKITERGQYAGRWLNFVGFFPADKPEYTCGVFVYRKAGHVGAANGGGTMSAPVLHEIAERVMAYQKTTEVDDLRDSTAVFIPDVKAGNAQAAEEVLDGLHIKNDSLRAIGSQQMLLANADEVPNVVGMGVKDAVFALESNGIKARLNGVGKVYKQSVAAGTAKRKGMQIDLYLK